MKMWKTLTSKMTAQKIPAQIAQTEFLGNKRNLRATDTLPEKCGRWV